VASDDMEAHAQAVARDDLDRGAVTRQHAAVRKLAEDRIAGHDRRVRAQRRAVADVLFGAVVPRAAGHLLADPAAAEGGGHEAAAGRTVVVRAREPCAKAALFRAGIDEGPGADR